MSSKMQSKTAISSSAAIKTRSDEASKLVARWYFGGLASAGAAVCTHPLDLVKVHLQTSGAGHGGLLKSTVGIIRNQGFTALYSGLTASLMRQLTYSTTRFAIYEVAKQQLDSGSSGGQGIPFYQKVSLAAVAGAAGGLVGTPADMINVRMQNDIKLPKDQRRNYKHAIDGLVRVYSSEGAARLFNGATMATFRAILMTIGQLSMYDQYKYLLLSRTNGMFKDDLVTHFTASLLAGASATTITQPLDVMKTRMMNAKPGEYRGIGHCAGVIFKDKGPLGFFKGYVPAFVRLAPQTILTFIFFEQLRMNFGKKPSSF